MSRFSHRNGWLGEFSDQPAVFGPALWGIVLSQIDMLPVDDDADLAGRLVQPVGGDRI